MKSVTINGREFLFVEVPEDATWFEIYDKESLPMAVMCYAKRSFNGAVINVPTPVIIPPGSYRILCKASEAGEKQAAQVVEIDSYNFEGKDYRGYKDYQVPELGSIEWKYEVTRWPFDNSKASLHSLILYLGMEVNKTIILEKLK